MMEESKRKICQGRNKHWIEALCRGCWKESGRLRQGVGKSPWANLELQIKNKNEQENVNFAPRTTTARQWSLLPILKSVTAEGYGRID